MNPSNNLLNVLTRSGVLINVSVRFWRGCKKLKPEDIGLEQSKLSDRLISLGQKRLLPKDATAALSLLEGRAHALIEANTFPFLNGLGHFLPNGRLAEVTASLKSLESDFWEAKSNFLEAYRSLRANAAREWRAMAIHLVADPERLMATIEASFPPIGTMEKYFGFDIQMFQVSLPERLSLELVSEAEQQEVILAREQAVQEASAKIRRETEGFVADCVATLRQQTATLCGEILHSINTSETGVHQKTLNRLVRFIDQFKNMNFAGDSEMEQQLDHVRRELLSRSAESYRDNAAFRQELEQGLRVLAYKANQLAVADASHLVQRFGDLGNRKFHLAA